jgi:hypothetical protein
MPSKVTALPVKRGFGETARRDAWWIQPLAVGTGFLMFIVYSTWAAFQGEYYHVGNLLSPFYSPELWYPAGAFSEHALFGAQPGWWPGWLPFSPAFLILWAPGGFRFTCYYYRGAYYKAFWAGSAGLRGRRAAQGYWGERRFPLILQNVHRYFLYLALLFLVFLLRRLEGAVVHRPGDGRDEFGIGVGTLVLAINVVLLAATRSAATRCGTWSAAGSTISSRGAGAAKVYDCVSLLVQRAPHAVGVAQPLLGGVRRPLRPPVSMGITDWRLL